MKDIIEHLIKLATDNAQWHEVEYKKTHDRNHLGQWVAYRRMAKKLKNLEVLKKEPPKDPFRKMHVDPTEMLKVIGSEIRAGDLYGNCGTCGKKLFPVASFDEYTPGCGCPSTIYTPGPATITHTFRPYVSNIN